MNKLGLKPHLHHIWSYEVDAWYKILDIRYDVSVSRMSNGFIRNDLRIQYKGGGRFCIKQHPNLQGHAYVAS